MLPPLRVVSVASVAALAAWASAAADKSFVTLVVLAGGEQVYCLVSALNGGEALKPA